MTTEAATYSQMNQLTSSEQVIVVTADRIGNQRATLQTYEKQNGRWVKVHSPMQAVLGTSGIDHKTKEGDGKTPIGVFELGTAFGHAPKPSGVSMPYRRAGSHDYWIDDPSSPDYNKWVNFSGNPQAKWKSFERMNHPLYKYGVVINYNMNPIVPGKGSAIFIHVWSSSTSPTAGCVAVSEQSMVHLLQWLDPNKNPLVVQGLPNQVNSLLEAHINAEATKLVGEAQISANNLRSFYQLQKPEDAVTNTAYHTAYNETRQNILTAQRALDAVTNRQRKDWLQEQLRYADELRVRAARIIDATKTSQGLQNAQANLHSYVSKGVLNQDAVDAYHHLSSEIRRTERAVYRIYGAGNRDLAGQQFVLPAKIERETVIWEVTIYEVLKRMEQDINNGNLATIDEDFALLSRLKVRSLDIKAAGNKLHPGMYPDLPAYTDFLNEWEDRLSGMVE
ncbi:L,D-transpeptidase family protein [Alkalihalobacillus deserti]|uniref:L,D-transpeptidase family protein n=1 Tax=Alkalihalobacillus deserti TaxID=2879466 RepID=UPI001D143D28|nr:L,D-transpeptidase family protein [Alkalihalobacillus deserti]